MIKHLFKDAQKPYEKLLSEMRKRQRKYHEKCEKQRILSNRLQYETVNAQFKPKKVYFLTFISPKLKLKLTFFLSFCYKKKAFDAYAQELSTKLEECRMDYEKSLKNLTNYHPIYVHDMTTIFMKCQDIEADRMSVFKAALSSVHKALHMIQDKRYFQCIRNELLPQSGGFYSL